MRVNAALAMLIVCFAHATSGGQVVLSRVALTNSTTGTSYLGLDDAPAIDNRGHVTFKGLLDFVPSDFRAGLWSGPFGDIREIARSNAPIVGDPLGRSFATTAFFSQDVPFRGLPTFDAAYLNADQSLGRARWGIAPAGPFIVADVGSAAPGGGTFAGFSFSARNESGQLSLRANLTDGSMGIWSNTGGSLSLQARADLPAPGTPAGTLFESFGFPNISPSGVTLFRGSLQEGTGGTTDSTSTGMWMATGGATSLVARAGDQAPGVPGLQVGRILDQPKSNRFNQFVFSADSNMGGQLVLLRDETGLHTVAYPGQEAPGMGSGVVFRSLSARSVSDSGRVLLDALTTSNGYGIFLADRSGAFDLVAAKGGQVPGEELGTTFYDLSSSQGNSQGQVMFLARLQAPTGDVSGAALFMTDADGTLYKVMSPGDLLETQPGSFREVTRINTYSSTFTDVDRCDFNDLGQAVFRAEFQGGTQAIYVAIVPEPTTLAALGVGLLGMLSRRPNSRRDVKPT